MSRHSAFGGEMETGIYHAKNVERMSTVHGWRRVLSHFCASKIGSPHRIEESMIETHEKHKLQPEVKIKPRTSN